MAYYYKKNYNTQKATDKYKNPDYGTIRVTVQPGGISIKEKEPYKVINLYNIDIPSALEIVSKLKEENRITRSVWVDKNDSTHISIKVLDKDIDAWLDGGDLNAIQSVLIKSGNYDNDEIMHLEDEIATGVKSKSKEVINTAHTEAGNNAMDAWQNYLSKITDPVTLERLKLYSRVYGNVSYGHMLSIKNASLIRSYDPTATFVLAPGQWRRLFGRGIKRNAKALPLYAWINKGDASQKDIQTAKNDSGWEETENQNLSTQVSYDIKMKANQNGGFVLRMVGYDVKDTYLLSGAKEDKWNTEIGLLNNLNGELNAAAKADQSKRGIDNNTTIDGHDEMIQRTEKAVVWMEEFCKQNGLPISNSTDPSNRLADMLLEYCRQNATKKSNILNPSNVEVYASNATQVTLILTNLGLDALKRFNATYQYDKKEAVALMNVVFNIAKKLEENSVLDEGIMSWFKDKVSFFKSFIQALRKIGCTVVNTKSSNQESNETLTQINEVKKQFNAFFNKINKNYF